MSPSSSKVAALYFLPVIRRMIMEKKIKKIHLQRTDLLPDGVRVELNRERILNSRNTVRNRGET
jgi:hypothetical protein